MAIRNSFRFTKVVGAVIVRSIPYVQIPVRLDRHSFSQNYSSRVPRSPKRVADVKKNVQMGPVSHRLAA